MRRVFLAVLLTGVAVGETGYPIDPAATSGAASKPQKLSSSLLPNGFRLAEKVFSGGLPEGDAAFNELSRLGIKTIISVDGAMPDVELATKHGLRYVHLPHGYDGISDERVMQLAKAVRDLPGPIYVHCHHGKHRSPAAAAAASITLGMFDRRSGREVLAMAGTSENYRGLYQTVDSARKLPPEQLDRLQVEFRAVAEIPPLAEAMVNIERTHERLKLLAAGDWQPVSDHPDLDPAHEALLLKEHFTELARSETVRKQPDAFQKIIRNSQQIAGSLEASLRDGKVTAKSRQAKLDLVTADCKRCHEQFRDVPLGEKLKP